MKTNMTEVVTTWKIEFDTIAKKIRESMHTSGFKALDRDLNKLVILENNMVELLHCPHDEGCDTGDEYYSDQQLSFKMCEDATEVLYSLQDAIQDLKDQHEALEASIDEMERPQQEGWDF